jgi:hypothetical protein
MISRYASLRQGLVGAWCPSLGASGFSLIDRSGYGNHGVLSSMDPGTDWVASGGKLALDFDGSTNNVLIPDSEALRPAKTITVSAWAFGTTSTGYVVFKRNSRAAGAGNFESYAIYSAGGRWGLTLSSPGGTQTSTDGPQTQNKWQFVTATFSRPNTTFYVDGVLRGTNTHDFDIDGIATVATNQLAIGRSNQSDFQYPFTGFIDDVRIYNRALTPTEINQLYVGGRGYGLAPERIKHRRKTTATAFNRRRRILIGASQ